VIQDGWFRTGDLARLKTQFDIPSLDEEPGGPPDLELYAQLYKPPVPHRDLPNADDESGV